MRKKYQVFNMYGFRGRLAAISSFQSPSCYKSYCKLNFVFDYYFDLISTLGFGKCDVRLESGHVWFVSQNKDLDGIRLDIELTAQRKKDRRLFLACET